MKYHMQLMLITLLAAPVPALAQTPEPPRPPGETVLNLSATEHGSIAQDQLTAGLSYQADDADPRRLQDKINTIMGQALARAKTVADVQVTTDSYYVGLDEPFWNGKGQKPAKSWRGSQSLQLKGKNAASLIALAGDLQNIGLTMQGLSYDVSPQKFEDARDALLDSAIAKLKDKADHAAKALGKAKADIVELNVDNNGGSVARPMMMKAMAMSSEAAPIAAPVASAGTSDIDLTVSAKIILRP